MDTTGAGDNFMSGFITGLVLGWDLRRCALFGTAAASLCVSMVGPTTAVRSFEQVEAHLLAHADESKHERKAPDENCSDY